jgi:hypothetical protein
LIGIDRLLIAAEIAVDVTQIIFQVSGPFWLIFA